MAAAGPVTTVDFSTDGSCHPLTSPPSDVAFAQLEMGCATFLSVRSYYDRFLYAPPIRTCR